jgi:hypothetical protein
MAETNLALVSDLAETLEEAHEIAGRLTQAGFARNSVKIVRRAEDSFEVSLHVREANRARAERAIANGFGGAGNGALRTLGIGAAALGAGLVAAVAARRMAPLYFGNGVAARSDEET